MGPEWSTMIYMYCSIIMTATTLTLSVWMASLDIDIDGIIFLYFSTKYKLI